MFSFYGKSLPQSTNPYIPESSIKDGIIWRGHNCSIKVIETTSFFSPPLCERRNRIEEHALYGQIVFVIHEICHTFQMFAMGSGDNQSPFAYFVAHNVISFARKLEQQLREVRITNKKDKNLYFFFWKAPKKCKKIRMQKIVRTSKMDCSKIYTLSQSCSNLEIVYFQTIY